MSGRRGEGPFCPSESWERGEGPFCPSESWGRGEGLAASIVGCGKQWCLTAHGCGVVLYLHISTGEPAVFVMAGTVVPSIVVNPVD